MIPRPLRVADALGSFPKFRDDLSDQFKWCNVWLNEAVLGSRVQDPFSRVVAEQDPAIQKLGVSFAKLVRVPIRSAFPNGLVYQSHECLGRRFVVAHSGAIYDTMNGVIRLDAGSHPVDGFGQS